MKMTDNNIFLMKIEHQYNLQTKLTPYIDIIELAVTNLAHLLSQSPPMRNRPKSLASLLFIDLNGPPAASFKPHNYVKSWYYKDITSQGLQNIHQVHCQANPDHYGQSGSKFQFPNIIVKKLTFIVLTCEVYSTLNST